MKCLLLVSLCLTTALADWRSGGSGGWRSGGDYNAMGGGYDEDYKKSTFNGHGAVIFLHGYVKYCNYDYKYDETYEALGKAAEEKEAVKISEPGKEIMIKGLSDEQARGIGSQVENNVKNSNPGRRETSRYRMHARDASNGGEYSKKKYYIAVRQLRCHCNEITNYTSSVETKDPYTVALGGGRRLWYNPKNGKYNGDNGGGYAGGYRKRSGYGNDYSTYYIPRKYSALLVFSYTIFCCKKIPAYGYGSKSYGGGGGMYGGGGEMYGGGGQYSGYRARREGGDDNGDESDYSYEEDEDVHLKCPYGYYLDYEAKSVVIDTGIKNKLVLGTMLTANAPVCAKDAYSGSEVPSGVKYAYVAIGPDYDTGYGLGKDYGNNVYQGYSGGSGYSPSGSGYPGTGSGYSGSGSGYSAKSYRRSAPRKY